MAYYQPKECDLSLPVEVRRDYCNEWTTRGLEGLISQKFTEEEFNKLVNIFIENKGIQLRKSADKIFDFALENEIPMYVLSAGLGDTIEPFLVKTLKSYSKLKEKNLVTLVSNRLYFDDSKTKCVGYKKPPLNTFTKTDVCELNIYIIISMIYCIFI